MKFKTLNTKDYKSNKVVAGVDLILEGLFKGIAYLLKGVFKVVVFAIKNSDTETETREDKNVGLYDNNHILIHEATGAYEEIK